MLFSRLEEDIIGLSASAGVFFCAWRTAENTTFFIQIINLANARRKEVKEVESKDAVSYCKACASIATFFQVIHKIVIIALCRFYPTFGTSDFLYTFVHPWDKTVHDMGRSEEIPL